MLNFLLLFLLVWGVVDVISGAYILLRLPLLLLGWILARPVRMGYTPAELEKIRRARQT